MSEPIEVRTEGGTPRYFLCGKELQPGDPVELESETGKWVTARFEPSNTLGPGCYQLLVLVPAGTPRPLIPDEAIARWPCEVKLVNAAEETLQLSATDWKELVRLCRLGGAEFLPDADVFSAEEAASLAAAVATVLPDVAPKLYRLPEQAPTSPLEWFASRREVLERFCQFCRRGAFCVRR